MAYKVPETEIHMLGEIENTNTYKTDDPNWSLPMEKVGGQKGPLVRFKKLHPDAKMPEYKTPGSVGMDLSSVENVIIDPGEHVLVSVGLAMALPRACEAQIRPRSGLAAKHKITVLNSPGTIDFDYRGEIKIILINHNNVPFTINKGDRIAQMVIAKVELVTCREVEELDVTARDSGGFGSTGTK